MSKITKLYRTWKRENPGFFNKNHVHEDKFTKAKSLFIEHLRNNKITLSEAKLEIEQNNHFYQAAINIAQFACDLLVGVGLGVNLNFQKTENISILLLYVALAVIGIISITITIRYLVPKFINKYTQNHLYSTHNFLMFSLQEYLSIYHNQLQENTIAVELRDTQLININPQAEWLYTESMQSAIYYTNAYKVEVMTKERTFEYILYTNDNPTSEDDVKTWFNKSCQQQIGKNWSNISDSNLTIERLSQAKNDIASTNSDTTSTQSQEDISESKYTPTKEESEKRISRIKLTGLFMVFVLACLAGSVSALKTAANLSALWIISIAVSCIALLMMRMTYAAFAELHCLSSNYIKVQYDSITNHAEQSFANIFVTFRSMIVSVLLMFMIGTCCALTGYKPSINIYITIGTIGCSIYGIFKFCIKNEHWKQAWFILFDIFYILATTAFLIGCNLNNLLISG